MAIAVDELLHVPPDAPPDAANVVVPPVQMPDVPVIEPGFGVAFTVTVVVASSPDIV